MSEFKGGRYNFYVAVECLNINRYIKSEGNLLLKTDAQARKWG